MKMLSALVGICILATAFAQGRPAYICEVLFDNFCPSNAATCANDPVLHFGSTPYSLSYFNLVSFGDMYGPSGDVEGRTAVRNNANLNAYSTGYQLRTSGVSANSPSYPYSMVIGGNAKWHGGSQHPDGSGFPFAGPKEYIFVGTDFSDADAYLQADRTGSCPTPGCLNADFDAAQAYYKDLSAAFGSLSDNAAGVVQWGTIDINCQSYATAQYVITISPDLFSTITSWNVNNVTCNKNSGLIVNIVGSGSQVKFAGATQTFFKNQKVLYNVVPTASTPSVRVEVGVNGNLLAPDSNYNQPGMGVFIGQVIVANVQQVLQINLIYCAPPPPTPNNNNSNSYLCPAWELACTGLDFTQTTGTYSFRDYNAISFGNFTADTGDIQGRLAVKGDCTFGKGWSVGFELQTATGTPDRHVDWSLVCGRDANWGSGSLHPDGTGYPFPGQIENMFIGGTFTSDQADLHDRNVGPCLTSAGCLDAEFNDAKTCYDTYSSNMANNGDNVAKNIQWSGLEITCNDASATDYYVSLTPAEFTQFTYTVIGNCNYQARWFINIRGTGNVEITGASFPGVPGGVVYNVVGCGRTVYIHDTTLNGGLLATCSTVNQPEGLIQGKVVAGNIIASRQINLQNTCPQQINYTVPVVTQVPSIVDSAQFTTNFLRVGDDLDGNTVVAYLGDNTYSFDKAPGFGGQQVIYFEVSSTDSRTPNEVAEQPSSASVVSTVAAFVVALIALAF